jgi:hypothetical protein
VPGLHLISMGRIRGSRRLDSRYVSIGVSKPGVCAHKVDEVSDHDSDLSALLIIAREDRQITSHACTALTRDEIEIVVKAAFGKSRSSVAPSSFNAYRDGKTATKNSNT